MRYLVFILLMVFAPLNAFAAEKAHGAEKRRSIFSILNPVNWASGTKITVATCGGGLLVPPFTAVICLTGIALGKVTDLGAKDTAESTD